MVLCGVLLCLLCNNLLHLPCSFQHLIPTYQFLPLPLALLGVVRLIALLDGLPCLDLHSQNFLTYTLEQQYQRHSALGRILFRVLDRQAGHHQDDAHLLLCFPLLPRSATLLCTEFLLYLSELRLKVLLCLHVSSSLHSPTPCKLSTPQHKPCLPLCPVWALNTPPGKSGYRRLMHSLGS